MTTASEHSLILPATADLVWGTVSFVIVALAIFKFAWPTFMRLLDERTQKIDEGLNQAERAREETARREAAQIRETAQSNAAAIVEDAKKNASVEAKRVADAAQRQIDADAKLARTQLRRDVGSLAAELAGRIVGEQALDPKVSSAVVDSFLDELEADVSAPAGPRPKEK